jgi:hypothetical protein
MLTAWYLYSIYDDITCTLYWKHADPKTIQKLQCSNQIQQLINFFIFINEEIQACSELKKHTYTNL